MRAFLLQTQFGRVLIAGIVFFFFCLAALFNLDVNDTRKADTKARDAAIAANIERTHGFAPNQTSNFSEKHRGRTKYLGVSGSIDGLISKTRIASETQPDGFGKLSSDAFRRREALFEIVRNDHADKGEAAYELGKIYRSLHGELCYRISFEWFLKSHQWGYPKARLKLAQAYAKGIGVKADIDQAAIHYRWLARNGDATAVFRLIELFEKQKAKSGGTGSATKEILTDLVPELRKQAESGDAFAARSLARLYRDGKFLERKPEEARKWFSLASERGDKIAKHDLAILILDLEPSADEFTHALDLLQKSSRAGYGAASTAIGRLHLKGKHGLSPSGAVEWFQRGIDLGHAGSMEEMAQLFFAGKLIRRNLTTALEYAEMGARLKHKGSIRLAKKIRAARTTKEFSEITKGSRG